MLDILRAGLIVFYRCIRFSCTYVQSMCEPHPQQRFSGTVLLNVVYTELSHTYVHDAKKKKRKERNKQTKRKKHLVAIVSVLVSVER